MDHTRTLEQIADWHRWFAVECNNAAWDLIGAERRMPPDDQRMLDLAHAAAFHWGQVGTPLNRARADVALARAHALAGDAGLALAYAQQSVDYFEHNPCEEWDTVFAHGALAHAAAAAGDHERHAAHYARAHALAGRIDEAEDRAIVDADLARLPQPEGWPA